MREISMPLDDLITKIKEDREKHVIEGDILWKKIEANGSQVGTILTAKFPYGEGKQYINQQYKNDDSGKTPREECFSFIKRELGKNYKIYPGKGIGWGNGVEVTIFYNPDSSNTEGPKKEIISPQYSIDGELGQGRGTYKTTRDTKSGEGLTEAILNSLDDPSYGNRCSEPCILSVRPTGKGKYIIYYKYKSMQI